MMDIDERQAIRQKHFKDTQGNCDWCCQVENWGSELNHLAVSWPCEVINLLNALELTMATLAVEQSRNSPRPLPPKIKHYFVDLDPHAGIDYDL